MNTTMITAGYEFPASNNTAMVTYGGEQEQSAITFLGVALAASASVVFNYAMGKITSFVSSPREEQNVPMIQDRGEQNVPMIQDRGEQRVLTAQRQGANEAFDRLTFKKTSLLGSLDAMSSSLSLAPRGSEQYATIMAAFTEIGLELAQTELMLASFNISVSDID